MNRFYHLILQEGGRRIATGERVQPTLRPVKAGLEAVYELQGR